MLKIQHKYIKYISQVGKEVDNIKLPNEVKEKFNFELIKDSLESAQLLIPIIGAFSAGKSSLINSFLGKNYLSVGITPETALATELHYRETEYIEAVKADDTIAKYSIKETDKIAENAHNFKYLRMYINNNSLKEIEPLILVDMPGFDSPLDLHNKAIMEYINKGVHYIVLTSVEDGTITRSMIRQLEDIQEYGRDFSFFLSKTNLKPKNEADEIAQNLKELIEEYFDIEKEIIQVDDNGGESLKKILKSINPEKLYKNLFVNDLKDNYYTISETLNTLIYSLEKDKNKNQEIINELQESIEKLKYERDRLIEEANERYSNTHINHIVESVGRELTNNMEELVNAATTGGQESLSKILSDIIRHSLIANIKDSINDIGDDIITNLSNSLSNLNNAMSEMTLSDNWLDKISQSTTDMLKNAKSGLDNIVNERKKSDKGGMYKAITTILAVTTEVINPALELVIVFLPEIIDAIFKEYYKRKQIEEIKNTIIAQIIPSVKREFRNKLPDVFNQQVKNLINDISERFENEIAQKQLVIETTQKEINEKITNIQDLVNSYKIANNNITALANEILFKNGE